MILKKEITIGDRVIPLQFSFMTIREIEKRGYAVMKLEHIFNNDLTGFLNAIVKSGAKVAVKANDDVLTDYDVADWVDEHGFSSETVQSTILEVAEYIQKAEGVPKNEIAVKPQRVKKATPPKK